MGATVTDDVGEAARAGAAALVDGLLSRVQEQVAATEEQRLALYRCTCATWESTAARAYRDALDRLVGRTAAVEDDLRQLAGHLGRLAEDLRIGRAGDLVAGEERVALSILEAYRTAPP